MKRLFDLWIALFGLLLLLPLFALIAFVVIWSSGFPVFFRQNRVGRRGRDFRLIKFRTMLVLRGAEAGSFDAGSVLRVTPIGRFLRKTKLDELPQLWNVVCGEMSLVGPRPEVRLWVEAYPERWAKVLQVRPGITDPASIEFRNEEEMLARSLNPELTYRNSILPRKLDIYELYVGGHTFWGDIGILSKTLSVVTWGARKKSHE